MAKSIIAYDKDLPEIPGRCPWEKPTSCYVNLQEKKKTLP
jgi:hypothetical protein